MVGCGAHGAGEEGTQGEEESWPCGTPQCVTVGDLSDEVDGEREEGLLVEDIL